jgi:hypothetical protein
MIDEVEILRELDEKMRQIAALYGTEKARADKFKRALVSLIKELNSHTGGYIADLVAAISAAENLVESDGE